MHQAHLVYNGNQSQNGFMYIPGMDWEVVQTVQTGSHSVSNHPMNYRKVVG